MRLVTGVAGKSSGVISSYDLREAFGLGTVGFVAASTENSSVELGRLDGCRIVSVPGLGAVTGFARNHDMTPLLLQVDDIGVASFADLVSGMGDGAGRNFGNGGAAIVSVLSKAARDHGGTQDDESKQSDHHDSGEADEMFNVLEQVALSAPDKGAIYAKWQ
jgi:hypothetical protein